MKKSILFATSVLLLLTGAGCFPSASNNAPTNAAPSTPVAGPGEHCGGNIQNAPECQTGYHCAPEADSTLPFGDVGGTCVKDSEVACTMEAKLCPDGSYVGRVAPSCDFAPCPGSK